MTDSAQHVEVENPVEASEPMAVDQPPVEIELTGDPRVDAALARLAELDELPTVAHVEVYDAVHRGLQDALADLDGS